MKTIPQSIRDFVGTPSKPVAVSSQNNLMFAFKQTFDAAVAEMYAKTYKKNLADALEIIKALEEALTKYSSRKQEERQLAEKAYIDNTFKFVSYSDYFKAMVKESDTNRQIKLAVKDALAIQKMLVKYDSVCSQINNIRFRSVQKK